jgi:nitrate reductase gamma subunit
MNLPAVLFSVIGWIALAVFAGGLLYRLVVYYRTPAPLKIPINTPPTMPGVVGNMALELVFFRKIFRTNPPLWLGAWIFHIAFALVVIRHLRFFFYPVPEWIMFFYTPGLWAGYGLLAALVYLLGRRLVAERTTYISTPMDYYLLFLLIGIAGSGLWMQVQERIYLVDVKAFALGLFSFSINAPDMHPLLVLHLLLVFFLLAYFPFSKLLHAPGVFFSPTMVQRNDIEKRRHVNPWDYDVPSEPFYILENFEEKRVDKNPEGVEYPPGWPKADYNKYPKGK